MIFSAYEHQKAGVVLDANLLYNLPMAEGTRIVPFLLAGGGWANAGNLSNQINSGEVVRDYTVLNLGIGTRLFLNNLVALRLEYRFQRFFAKKEELPFGGVYDPSLNCHNILVGLSFAF
jgi:opacity protein-like surface antigen